MGTTSSPSANRIKAFGGLSARCRAAAERSIDRFSATKARQGDYDKQCTKRDIYGLVKIPDDSITTFLKGHQHLVMNWVKTLNS